MEEEKEEKMLAAHSWRRRRRKDTCRREWKRRRNTQPLMIYGSAACSGSAALVATTRVAHLCAVVGIHGRSRVLDSGTNGLSNVCAPAWAVSAQVSCVAARTDCFHRENEKTKSFTHALYKTTCILHGMR